MKVITSLFILTKFFNTISGKILPLLIIFLGISIAGLIFMSILLTRSRRINKEYKDALTKNEHEIGFHQSAFSTMFESIPDIVFCKDLNLNFTRVNTRFENHFNRKEEDVIGKDDETGLGLPHDIAEAYRAVDRKVIEKKTTMATEEIIPSHDGNMYIFETLKTPLLKNGRAIGIMGISRDITKRKAALEALNLTLDNLDTLIYINELDTGKILFVNKKMSKEFGGSNFIGKVCWKVFQDGFTERCSFCPIPKLIESGDDYLIWEEHNTVTGKHYRNTDSIIRWHDGRLVHMQHSVDVTDLINMRQELENASKAKSDFLSRMSHEIRTPLNAIIGMNAIAFGTTDIEKIKYCHERIDNASKHLLGVINDILDMSKIEANKFELSPTEFNFEKMLMNITNVTSFKADEKKQNLIINLNENVPTHLVCDEIRLAQVITNLLSNAIKFTPENGTIILNAEKITNDGNEMTLRFIVEDTGIGVSPEQQQKLFSSFEQADGSISRKFGGTGLGLVICKRIVELMGGTIKLESELGKGSKFIFTIKAYKGSKSDMPNIIRLIDRENLRIMAVDDCLETREYFKHFMKVQNLPCNVAANAFEALEFIKKAGDKPYNVFFVDWQMPEINGIELTKKIKEMTGDNSVVIMISVADWSQIEKQALSAGVSRFIAKPLFPSTLIDAINSCLKIDGEKKDDYCNATVDYIRNTFTGHKILIAEDNEINREIIAAVLENTGLTIDFAVDGVKAVKMFEDFGDEYSLIFMDIHMPEMDGYETTKRIRAFGTDNAKNIPIIAMTANVFREDIEQCIAAGMNDHVGKPIDQKNLFSKMSRYLK